MAEKYPYKLSNGRTLVMTGDKPPSPDEVIQAAESIGIPLHDTQLRALMAEKNKTLIANNSQLSDEEKYPKMWKAFNAYDGMVNSPINRAVNAAGDATLGRITKGVDRMAHGEYAGGASDVIRGAATSALPLLPVGLAEAPIATVLGLAGSAAGSAGGGALADRLGATPDQSALASDVGGIAGGGLGGLIGSKVPTAPVRKGLSGGLNMVADRMDKTHTMSGQLAGMTARKLASAASEPKAPGLETAADAVARRVTAQPPQQVRPVAKAGKFTTVEPEATTLRQPYLEPAPAQPAAGLESPQDALARMTAAGSPTITPSGAATSRIPYTGPQAPPPSPNAGGMLNTTKAPTSLDEMLQSLQGQPGAGSAELPAAPDATAGGRLMGSPSPKPDEFGDTRPSAGRAVSYTSGNPGTSQAFHDQMVSRVLGQKAPAVPSSSYVESTGAVEAPPQPAQKPATAVPAAAAPTAPEPPPTPYTDPQEPVDEPSLSENAKSASGEMPEGDGASGLPAEDAPGLPAPTAGDKVTARSLESIKTDSSAQPKGEGAVGLKTGKAAVEPRELPADATRVEMTAELARRLGTPSEVDVAGVTNARVAKSARQAALRKARQ